MAVLICDAFATGVPTGRFSFICSSPSSPVSTSKQPLPGWWTHRGTPPTDPLSGGGQGFWTPYPRVQPPYPRPNFPLLPPPPFFPLFFFSGTPVPNSNFLPPPIWPPPIFRQKPPYPLPPPVLPHHWGSRDFQSDFNDSNILLMLVMLYFCYQPFHKHGLTLIPEWISNYINYQGCEEITYPFPNFNGCTVEIWEWINNFISHFTGHVITYPFWDLN